MCLFGICSTSSCQELLAHELVKYQLMDFYLALKIILFLNLYKQEIELNFLKTQQDFLVSDVLTFHRFQLDSSDKEDISNLMKNKINSLSINDSPPQSLIGYYICGFLIIGGSILATIIILGERKS